jgi:hypothetical protein
MKNQKKCPDCAAMNTLAAVSCRACGSLFTEMVGIVGEDQEVDAAQVAQQVAARVQEERSPARSAGLLECADCGLAAAAGQRRCSNCGSNRLRARRVERLWETPDGKRLTALMTRHQGFAEDIDVPYYTSLLLITGGVLAFLIQVPLGATLVLARLGPNGVAPYTFEWRYLLGGAMLLAALLSGMGAYALFFLQRIGAVMLACAFAIDTLLFGWLVVALVSGNLATWPGAGPYAFFGLVTGIAAANSALMGCKSEFQ